MAARPLNPVKIDYTKTSFLQRLKDACARIVVDSQAQPIQKKGNKKPQQKRLFAEDFFWFFDRFAGIYEQFDGFTNG